MHPLYTWAFDLIKLIEIERITSRAHFTSNIALQLPIYAAHDFNSSIEFTLCYYCIHMLNYLLSLPFSMIKKIHSRSNQSIAYANSSWSVYPPDTNFPLHLNKIWKMCSMVWYILLFFFHLTALHTNRKCVCVCKMNLRLIMHVAMLQPSFEWMECLIQIHFIPTLLEF